MYVCSVKNGFFTLPHYSSFPPFFQVIKYSNVTENFSFCERINSCGDLYLAFCKRILSHSWDFAKTLTTQTQDSVTLNVLFSGELSHKEFKLVQTQGLPIQIVFEWARNSF
jgi:hypothetical protein